MATISTNRISTYDRHTKLINTMNSKAYDLSKLEIQASNPGVINTFSDIEKYGITKRILSETNTIQDLDTLKYNDSFMYLRISAIDNALTNIYDITLQFLEDCMQNNLLLEHSSLKIFANKSLENIQKELNTNVDSIYLFAGSKHNIKPVDTSIISFESVECILNSSNEEIKNFINTKYYQGDDVANETVSIYGEKFKYGVTGNREEFAMIIAAFQFYNKSDNNPESLNKVRYMLDTALDGLIGTQQEVRQQARVINIRNEIYENSQILSQEYLEEEKSQVQSSDLVYLIDAISRNTTILNATYYLYGNANKTSLLDILK